MVRLESWSAVALGVGLLGAMYAIVGALSTTPSRGPLRPCRSLADSLLAQMGGGTLVCVGPGFGLVVEVSALVVTRVGCSVACLIAIGMRLDLGSVHHSRQSGVLGGCGG